MPRRTNHNDQRKSFLTARATYLSVSSSSCLSRDASLRWRGCTKLYTRSLHACIACALWFDGLSRSIPAVSGRTDGRQAAVTNAGRLIGRVAYVPGVFSGHAAARLSVCALADGLRVPWLAAAFLPRIADWGGTDAGGAANPPN